MLPSLSLILIVALVKMCCPLNVSFPEPFTQKNRLMGFILAYNYDHIDPMFLIFAEYVNLCESGWNPTIVIFTTTPWTPLIRHFVKFKTFCHRTNSSIPVRYSVHSPTISIGLGAVHRQVLFEEIENYDLFVYHEDDVILKHSHVVTYVGETKRLYELMPESIHHFCIGFQRYRRIRIEPWAIQASYGVNDIVEQDLLEELPNFRPVCIKGQPFLRVEGNTHQAIWMLTQDIVKVYHARCKFMNHSFSSREHMSSFTIFDNKYGGCGLQKILPYHGLQSMLINHFYPQRHVQWTSSYKSFDNIMNGYHYTTPWPRDDHKHNHRLDEVPICWRDIVVDYRRQYKDMMSVQKAKG